MKNFEISLGFYPGLLLGFRTYKEELRTNHVFYVPFIDLCITQNHEQ